MMSYFSQIISKIGRGFRFQAWALTSLLAAAFIAMGAAPAKAVYSYSAAIDNKLSSPGQTNIHAWGDLGGLALDLDGQWVDVTISLYLKRPGETSFSKVGEASYSGASDVYDLMIPVSLPGVGTYSYYTEGVYTLLQDGETITGSLDALDPNSIAVRYPSRRLQLSPTPANPTYRVNSGVVVIPNFEGGTANATYWRVSGPCTVNRLAVTLTGAGDCVVGASVPENALYPAATTTLTITIAPTPRTLSLTSSATALAFGSGASASLTAAPSAGGGAITYRVVSGPCSVAGQIVSPTGSGVCVLRSSVVAADDYAAVESIDLQIRVDRGQRSLAFVGAPSSAMVGTSVALNVQPSAGGGAVSFSVVSGPCALRGASVTPSAIGACVIRAQIEADTGFEAASVDLTLNATRAARRLDLVVTPANIAVGGTAELRATPTSGAGEIRYQLLSGPCSLSGATLRGDSVGLCRVQATIAAFGDEIATASPILEAAVGKAATSVTLTIANTAPILGAPVSLTASVSPAAATGLVTFRDNGSTIAVVALSGGVATAIVTSLALGAHDIVATYAGDAAYFASTSVGLRVTPTRPPPNQTATVLDTLNRQTQVVQRATSGANDAIQRRLETLHGDNIPTFSNGISFAGGGAAQATPASPAGLPSAARAYGPDDGAAARRMAAFVALDRQTEAERTPAPSTAAPAMQPAFYTWTAGTIQVAEARNEGLPDKTKSRYQSLAIGFDRPFGDDLKLGVTVGLLHGKDTTGSDGSQSRVLVWNAALYQSWRVLDQVFLDTLLGLGTAQFRLKRFDANAAGLLQGDRAGRLALGAVTLSWERSFGALKYAPYGKFDFLRSKLGGYSESGDPNFALDFGALKTSGYGLTAGVRAQYDVPALGGVVSPTLRVEYRRSLTANAVQNVAFVSDPGTTYAVNLVSPKRDSLTGGFGLKASGGAATGQIEYFASLAPGGGYRSQGLRGTLRVGF